jgi:hypothetical protein
MNKSNFSERYLDALIEHVDILMHESVKDLVGSVEQDFCEKAEHLIKNPYDAASLIAVEDSMQKMKDDSERGSVRPFSEIIRKYAEATERPIGEIREAVVSHDYSTLVPQVVAGGFIEPEEMEYIGSYFLKTQRVNTSSTMIEYYSHTPVQAHWTAEALRGAEVQTDLLTFRQLSVKVRPFEVTIGFTEEALRDAMWAMLEIQTKEAQRSMNRFKEEYIWREFEKNSHVIFDPDLGTANFAVTGIDNTYTENNTLSVDDFLDLVATMYLNKFRPTDVMFHPLHYLTFVKTAITGGLFLPEANKAAIAKGFTDEKSGKESFITSQLGGLLPNVWTTPYVPFNIPQSKADMFVVDRGQVGFMLTRDGQRKTDWDDPGRGMRWMKLKDEMGVAILHEGKAILQAKNLSIERSYNPDITFIYDVSRA